MDAEQIKTILINMLPMAAPIILEFVKSIAPRIMEKVPWYFKPIMTAVISALIGMLGEYGAGGGAVIGASSSIAYGLARNKEPKYNM